MKFRLIICAGVLAIVLSGCHNSSEIFHYVEGNTMGTFFHIKYKAGKNNLYKASIDSLLIEINNSLSTYIPESTISRVNQSKEAVEVDEMFLKVFEKSKEVYERTQGAFDPTVMPLVNAWGFGFEKKSEIDSTLIDSLLEFVGFDKIYVKEGKVYKTDYRVQVDFSAIAKGFGVDLVAELLESYGIENYMVEIGGELRLKGLNPENKEWKVGVEQPNENERVLNATMAITNIGMATSGNYRNFYYENGKRYAHTINPRSGYPIQHSLLSATVVAPDCMTADAYATAFMVLGVERAKDIVGQTDGLEIYLLYENDKNELDFYATDSLKNKLEPANI